jgi:hypothetical protein
MGSHDAASAGLPVENWGESSRRFGLPKVPQSPITACDPNTAQNASPSADARAPSVGGVKNLPSAARPSATLRESIKSTVLRCKWPCITAFMPRSPKNHRFPFPGSDCPILHTGPVRCHTGNPDRSSRQEPHLRDFVQEKARICGVKSDGTPRVHAGLRRSTQGGRLVLESQHADRGTFLFQHNRTKTANRP